jgi:hypothetical protein
MDYPFFLNNKWHGLVVMFPSRKELVVSMEDVFSALKIMQ